MNSRSNGSPEPPGSAVALLQWLLPLGSVGKSILGDLRQEYAGIFRKSPRAASRWYWQQTISIGWRYALAKIGRAQPKVEQMGREATGGMISVGTLLQDTRFAIRSFWNKPGFSLTVIALVALGVGSTTTIFSVVDNILLKPLPYPESEQLVLFDNAAHSVPLFRDWQDGTGSYSAMAGAWNDGFDLTGGDVPEKIDGERVTPEYFQMLGARPAVGRLFDSSDFDGIPVRTIVISHGLWQRRWGGDRDVVGRTVTVNEFPMEIVGVLDSGFTPPMGSEAELFLPLDVTVEAFQDRGFIILGVIARLRPGASLEVAQAEMNALSAALAEEHPDTDRQRDGSPDEYPILPLLEATVGDIGNTLFMLLGAVGLMLLIACANVANLFLARGTDRVREMALRAALGAGRKRIVAQLLTESVLLSVVGGVLGIGLTLVGVNAFEFYSPGGIPRVEQISIDLRVLGFALLVSVTTGILFGMVPAINAARADVREAMSESASADKDRRRPVRLRSALVVTEIAMALMLLIGAGLLFRSFVSLSNVEMGYEVDDVLVLPLELGGRFPGQESAYFARDLMERIAAIPGVETVGAGTTVPPTGRYMCCWMGGIRNDSDAEFDDPFSTIAHPITDDYFDAIGAEILRGRSFSGADADIGVGSAVINESVASFLFGESDPIGKSFWFRDVHLNVVGVVNDIRHWRLSRGGEYNVYLPFTAHGDGTRQIQVAVKSAIDSGTLTASLRDVVWSIDGDQPVGDIIQLEQKVARSIAQPRFLSILLLTFSGFAVLLAAAGIYGSMLYSVSQRQKELGIRLALGAGTGSVIRMIVRRGLVLTLSGLVIGIGGAFALSRTLESLLFGVTPVDPSTFVVVPLLLGLVALAACFLPARKAACADPVETLRAE